MKTSRGVVLVALVMAGCGGTPSEPMDMGTEPMDSSRPRPDAAGSCRRLDTPTLSVDFKTGQDCGDVADGELLTMLSPTAIPCAVRDVAQADDCSIAFETECEDGGVVWEWRGTVYDDGEGWAGIVSRRTLTDGVVCWSEYRLTVR